MKGIIINNGDDFYISYAVEGEDSDAIDYRTVSIDEPEEWLDLTSGTRVEFSIKNFHLGGMDYEIAFITKYEQDEI